jgi:hypothetical protein
MLIRNLEIARMHNTSHRKKMISCVEPPGAAVDKHFRAWGTRPVGVLWVRRNLPSAMVAGRMKEF